MIFLVLAILGWGYCIYLHIYPPQGRKARIEIERRKFIENMWALGIFGDELKEVLKDYTCFSDYRRANKKLKKYLVVK